MPNDATAEFYAERRRHFEQLGERLGRRSRLVSNLRGLSFGLTVIALLIAVFGGSGAMAGLVAAGAAVAFFVLVTVHPGVLDAEETARRWARVNFDAEARAAGSWLSLTEDGARYRDPSHPYAEDLDLFGRGSLFQRICVAHTRFGQDRLAEMLCSAAAPADIRARQRAVRALATELDLRQEFEAHALAVVERPTADSTADRRGAARREPPDPSPFLAWSEAPNALRNRTTLVWLARLLPPVTVGAVLAASFGALPAFVWAVPLASQILVNLSVAGISSRTFWAVSATQGAFLRYGAMLGLLENMKVSAPLLQSIQARLAEAGTSPSAAMRQFRRIVSWFDLRHNGLVHPFANALLMWDIHCVLALESWRNRAGNRIRAWFSAIGEVEALTSFAGLAHDEAGFCDPQIIEGEAHLHAVGLGHPLIVDAKRVDNDVGPLGPGSALLVTGSNMSGKSTLLRSIGLAAVMAQAGCPVCARRLTLSPLTVVTSVRVSDSLEAGVSRFYAEVAKLKRAVDTASGAVPLLFLLDEILHGTNSRERQIGARWVIGELLARGAVGAASTHDEALCRLTPDLQNRVTQVHFEESVSNEAMTFDYELRPGPVRSGNALRLMRTVGLDVPLE